jgi:Tol biopolymer transport system component
VTFPEEELWRANLDGSGAMKLTSAPLAVKSAQWSPDGTQVLIEAQTSNDNIFMYVVPAQGGPPRRLLPTDSGAETDPRWSPDGTRVVYSTAADGWTALNRPEIRILEIASSRVTPIEGSGEDMSPRWSPDGRYIAALTISDHKLRVYDLQLARWINVYEGIANFPSFSKDGSLIYFANESGTIFRVPVKGGSAQLIIPADDWASTGTFGGWFGMDPDDVPLALRDNGVNEIFGLTLDTK